MDGEKKLGAGGGGGGGGGCQLFWKKTGFYAGFEGVQREFLSERKGKGIPCRGPEDGKDSGTESGKSGMILRCRGFFRTLSDPAPHF